MEKKKILSINMCLCFFRTNLPFTDFSSEDSDDSDYSIYSSSSESVEDYSMEDYSESEESNEDEGYMHQRTRGANSIENNSVEENAISPSSDDVAIQRLVMFKESVACLILRAGCQHNHKKSDKKTFMNHGPKHNQLKKVTHKAEPKPLGHLKSDELQVRMNSSNGFYTKEAHEGRIIHLLN